MSHSLRSILNAGRAPAWVSRHFRGLTWSMFGVLCLIAIAMGSTQLLHLLRGPMEIDGVKETLEARINFTLKWTLQIGLSLLPILPCLIVALNVQSKTVSGRVFALASAVLVGTIAGEALMWWSRSFLFGGDWTWEPSVFVLGEWLTSLTLAGVAAALLYLARRDSEAMERLHQEELDRLGLDRQMTEARLNVLQAQIEPHFLFNTLANVQRLYEIDPPSGKSMLQHLRGYLAAALPEMRVSKSTLGRELALTLAYLNVQKIRMGARLVFDIDVPERLMATPIPSMVLVTLAENAIKHGLAPLPEGGSIRIAAREHAGHLQLQVLDDGAGLRLTAGAGVGLANTRLRLATLYGNAARLLLEQNVTRGVTATIELPIEKAAAVVVTT
jgi:Histidine kinase